MKRWWLSLLCVLIALPSWADNDAAEKRMLDIASELRCLVCQNESIAASCADLAVDLRQQIREQIQAGKSDTDIRSYMVDRYGDFVLYRTPFKATTLLLWFGPLLLLAFGFLVLTFTLRRRKSGAAETALSDEAHAVNARRPEDLLRHTRA